MQRTLNNILANREMLALLKGKRAINTMSQSFDEFCNRILPSMEEKVETDILRDLYHKTSNKLMKKEILNSYKRRKLDLHFKSRGIEAEPFTVPKMDATGNLPADPTRYSIRKIDIHMIGSPFEIMIEDIKKYFSTGLFGYKEFVPNFYGKSYRAIFLLTEDLFKLIQMCNRNSAIADKVFNQSNPQLLQSQNKDSMYESLRSASIFANEDEEFELREKFQRLHNLKDVEYFFRDINMFLSVIAVFRDSFRKIVDQETQKWVRHSEEIRTRRHREKKPKKFHNLFLEEPENIYSNYLPSLGLDEMTGEDYYNYIDQGEKDAIAREKKNGELIDKISGQGPRNEILIDGSDTFSVIDQENWGQLEWNDENISEAERDYLNSHCELFRNLFSECFLRYITDEETMPLQPHHLEIC